jgi:hypothetical protein
MRIGKIVPNLVKRYLDPAVRRRCMYMVGASGIGKSEAVHQASALLADHIENWQGVEDLRLSQMDVVDLRGIPSANADHTATTWLVPEFFPRDGAGILFLDELSSAPPAIQAGAYQLILERRLGKYKLPDGWMIVAAGNRTTDRGVTFQLAAPLLNRMTMVEVKAVFEDFQNYAMAAGVRPEIVTFLKDRPDYLHKFEPKGVIEPFPSPRSWFAVSDLLNMDTKTDDRLEMMHGTVGHEAAEAFEAHLRFFEQLPSIQDILDGKPVDVPKEMHLCYCVGMGLSARMNASTFGNAWKFLEKLPKDIQTLSVKLAYKRDKTITQSPAFVAWAAENQNAFRRG